MNLDVPSHECLDATKDLEDCGLPGSVGSHQQIDAIQLEFEVHETLEVVGVEVRQHQIIEEPSVAGNEWEATEIDGSVMVDEALPVGEFADITSGDWRGYDLVAAR